MDRDKNLQPAASADLGDKRAARCFLWLETERDQLRSSVTTIMSAWRCDIQRT